MQEPVKDARERTSIIQLKRPSLSLGLITIRWEHKRSLLNLVVDSHIDVGANIESSIRLHVNFE